MSVAQRERDQAASVSLGDKMLIIGGQGGDGEGGVTASEVELQAKVIRRFPKISQREAPTRAFSWLKAPTSAFTFKTHLRHGRAGWLA